MAGEKILVVDDEPEISHLLSRCLINERYEVITADNGHTAIDLTKKMNPDLIILDILLPDIDGIEVCSELRKITVVPIIFLSCKSEDIDKILGLGVGGDDYVTKPFSLGELTARIKAHLRRNRLMKAPEKPTILLEYPGLKIDINSCCVFVNGNCINLSAKEFQLLKILAQSPNRVYQSDQLFELIWGEENLGDARTVSVHISNLRKKIERDPSNPKYIITLRGIGYKFNAS